LSAKLEVELKLAVTVVAALIDTVQVPVPVHPPPLHLANVEPLAAVAVNVTDAPLAKGSEQSAPQLIPVPITVPFPIPFLFTVSVKVDVAAAVVAHCSFENPELPATLNACTR